MPSQLFNLSRDETLRPWTARGGGRAGSLFVLFVVWVFASSAIAAEIVEVRVGRHPTFTRVVFELDRAAGYRIERTEPSPGTTELVVSVEATSIPRHVTSEKTLITDVDVIPRGGRAVARIGLAKDGLKLKEMILTRPPRIVLDVLSDEPAAVPAIAKTKPKTTPKSTPKTSPKPTPRIDPKPAPLPVEPEPFADAKPKPAPEPMPEPAKVPTPIAADPDPEPFVMADPVPAEPGTDMGAADPADSFAPPPSPLPSDDPAANAMDGALEDPNAGSADQANAFANNANDGFDPAADPTAGIEPDMDRNPVPAPPPIQPAPRPMVAETDAESDGGGGWMTWALTALGIVVLLVGGAMVLRSRSGGSESYDDEADSFGDGASADNPFAGSESEDDQFNLDGSDATSSSDGDETVVSSPQDSEEKESESVVFADSEEEAMEVISRDDVNESLGMPPEMGALPEEFQQMMRDMNSRVQALEGRIDELVDARDRLERQVAAQTEELRVQRAAIARTQRAVRNLARPEDEEEHEATEPALREPNPE